MAKILRRAAENYTREVAEAIAAVERAAHEVQRSREAIVWRRGEYIQHGYVVNHSGLRLQVVNMHTGSTYWIDARDVL